MNRLFLASVLALAVTCLAVAQDTQDQTKNEIRVFNLKNLRADEAAKLLTDTLGEQDGESIAVDSRHNALITNSTPNRLQTMEALLLKLDATPAERVTTTTLYRLQHAPANAVGEVLTMLFEGRQTDAPFRIGVDERSNSIVVSASLEMHKRIQPLIADLDRKSNQNSEASAFSIRFEVYWIVDGEESTQLPTEIRQVLKQDDRLGISKPKVLASASVAAYIDGSSRGGRVSLRNIKSSDGSELDCTAMIESLGDQSFKLELQLTAGAKSKTSIQTTVRTSLGHPVFVASTTTSSASDKPTVFVLRISN